MRVPTSVVFALYSTTVSRGTAHGMLNLMREPSQELVAWRTVSRPGWSRGRWYRA